MIALRLDENPERPRLQCPRRLQDEPHDVGPDLGIGEAEGHPGAQQPSLRAVVVAPSLNARRAHRLPGGDPGRQRACQVGLGPRTRRRLTAGRVQPTHCLRPSYDANSTIALLLMIFFKD